MANVVESIVIGDYMGNVVIDEEPVNPRENSNLGTMVCFHKQYLLGDEQSAISPAEFMGWEDFRKILTEEYGASIVLPLYLFDHGGISISVTPFNDHWDSGQVGFIYVTGEDIRKEVGGDILTENRERAEELLKSEVDTYNRYLGNNTYCIRIYEKKECNLGHTHLEPIVKNVCGFDSIDDAIKEIKRIIEEV